ncbi:hypothetical protein ACWDA9_32035, partial [Streptomyces sp. NPDC001193]
MTQSLPAEFDTADMTWPPPPYQRPVPPVTGADGIRRFDGITYATTPGYRPRLLDVQLPAGEGPFPAVLLSGVRRVVIFRYAAESGGHRVTVPDAEMP